MGIFSMISNRKKTQREKHSMRRRREEKATRKAAKGPLVLDIEYANLYSSERLKNKLRNPRNNVDISNKKRKRILKRLKHQQIGDHEKDKDVEEGADTEMAETAEVDESAAAACCSQECECGPSCSTNQTATTKKRRKRGGRKKKKGKATDAVTEDVDMAEED